MVVRKGTMAEQVEQFVSNSNYCSDVYKTASGLNAYIFGFIVSVTENYCEVQESEGLTVLYSSVQPKRILDYLREKGL